MFLLFFGKPFGQPAITFVTRTDFVLMALRVKRGNMELMQVQDRISRDGQFGKAQNLNAGKTKFLDYHAFD